MVRVSRNGRPVFSFVNKALKASQRPPSLMRDVFKYSFFYPWFGFMIGSFLGFPATKRLISLAMSYGLFHIGTSFLGGGGLRRTLSKESAGDVLKDPKETPPEPVKESAGDVLKDPKETPPEPVKESAGDVLKDPKETPPEPMAWAWLHPDPGDWKPYIEEGES